MGRLLECISLYEFHCAIVGRRNRRALYFLICVLLELGLVLFQKSQLIVYVP